MTIEKIESLPLSQLVDSPTQPRLSYAEGPLQELAESIKSQGVQQPIVVRPRAVGANGLIQWEIVFGHRRTRAARLAGLESIPAVIRDMDDEQVATVQMHENIEREDMSAIEEAMGFDRLMKEFGQTVADIMTSTGKSRTYVYNRLKLLALAPEARQACLDGVIGAEVATMVARVPARFHVEALDRVTDEGDDGKPVALSFRDARRNLALDFTADLLNAVWSLDDDLADVGPCRTCPSNTACDPEAAAEFGPDTCMNTACFTRKHEAHIAAAVEQARAEGRLVPPEDRSKIVHWVSATSEGLVYGAARGFSGYVDNEWRSLGLSEMAAQLSASGEQVPTPKVAQGHLGLENVYPMPEARDIIDSWTARFAPQHPSSPGSASGGTDGAASEPEEEEEPTPEEAALRDPAHRLRVIQRIARIVACCPRTLDELRLVVHNLLDQAGQWSPEVDTALGITFQGDALDDGPTVDEQRQTWVDQATADQLGALLVIDAMADRYRWWGRYGRGNDGLPELAARYGVDLLNPDGVQTPAPDELVSTPSDAARAAEGAAEGDDAAEPAAEAKPKGKAKGKAKKPKASSAGAAEKVKDEPADAGGSDAEPERDPNTADMFERAH